MHNIIDSLKQFFIVVTTSVAVLNPFNVTLPTKNAAEIPQTFVENTPTTVPNAPTSIPYTQPVRDNTQQSAQKSQSTIDCTGPDGKHFQTTQQECDSFNAAWKKPQQNNTVPQIPQGTTKNTSPSEPAITCVLSYGTYKLTQSSCDSFKNSDKQYVPIQYYPCTLYYPALKISSTYTSLYKTKEECDEAQQSLNKSGANSNSGQTQQPTSAPDNSYNQQQNGQCKMYANQWYTNQGTQCSGSCAQAIKQIAYPQYQQKLKDCDQQYPVN